MDSDYLPFRSPNHDPRSTGFEMNALVKTEPGRAKLALKNVPEPHPEAGHVVIEVSACGICGTDIHHYDDEFPSISLDTTSIPKTATATALRLSA